jgi:hypothetical protein
MKMISLILLFAASSALAQTAAIKDIPADGDAETTISISKGKKGTAEYEISEGKADISGDPEVLTKEARNSWKKACDDWKKEIKDLNKDNQVLALSCNSPSCTKNSMTETVCQSSGVYKVKTKIK